jgi:hypothetical protein
MESSRTTGGVGFSGSGAGISSFLQAKNTAANRMPGISRRIKDGTFIGLFWRSKLRKFSTFNIDFAEI